MTAALDTGRPPLRLRLAGEPRFAIAECVHDIPGRCPHATCRFHLASDWKRHGGLPDWVPSSCALELAEAGGGLTLAAVGVVLGQVSRERIRQIEAKALRKLGLRARALKGEPPE